MTMQDPIADMLTYIRNAHLAKHREVNMPSSKIKVKIAGVLREEGYIEDFGVSEDIKPRLNIKLKYYQGAPVITELHRTSRPGLRVYKSAKELPRVRGGLGISIISTSQGILSSREASKRKLGGEVVCTVF